MRKKEDRDEDDDLMDVARMTDAHRRGDEDEYDAIVSRRKDSGKDGDR